jgi:hypothetical protein
MFIACVCGVDSHCVDNGMVFVAGNGVDGLICRNFQVVRGLVPCLDGNQRWTPAAKVRKVLFADKRKERPHGVMHRDPETGGPLGQVGN